MKTVDTTAVKRSKGESVICWLIRWDCCSWCLVTGANVDDGTAAPLLLEQVTQEEFPRLKMIFGDSKYRNKRLQAWLSKERPGWEVEVKQRPKGSQGFTPVRKRWVVERSNAWHGRCHRNSKDYERRSDSSAAMI